MWITNTAPSNNASWLPFWPVIVAILGAAVVYGATATRLEAVERRMDRFETQQREDLNKILEGVNDVRDRLARIEGNNERTK